METHHNTHLTLDSETANEIQLNIAGIPFRKTLGLIKPRPYTV